MKRWGVLLATVASCATAPPPDDPAGRADRRSGLGEAALTAVAARPEVVAIDGDIALLCSEGAPGTDADDGQPDCDAARIGVDGALTELGRGGLIAAGRLDARRLLLLTRDRSLRLRTEATATEIELARDVADPRLAPDRRAVAFTQLPPGATIAPSTTGRLVVLDLDRGTRRLVTDHPLDSSPFIRPGSDDVVFVSGRTGVASLWLARPGAAPRQLTNRGAREVGPGFVPVPGRELVWLDRDTAVYTATYAGVSTLWALDVARGAAAPIGAGRWPQRAAAGDRVVAIDGDGAAVTIAAAAIAARLADAAPGEVRP